MSHTPGPWEWDAPISDFIIGKDSEGNIFALAVVGEYILAGDKDANGNLIAAAPELLEACKRAVMFVETRIGEQHSVAKDLWDAIKRAEGREH